MEILKAISGNYRSSDPPPQVNGHEPGSLYGLCPDSPAQLTQPRARVGRETKRRNYLFHAGISPDEMITHVIQKHDCVIRLNHSLSVCYADFQFAPSCAPGVAPRTAIRVAILAVRIVAILVAWIAAIQAVWVMALPVTIPAPTLAPGVVIEEAIGVAIPGAAAPAALRATWRRRYGVRYARRKPCALTRPERPRPLLIGTVKYRNPPPNGSDWRQIRCHPISQPPHP